MWTVASTLNRTKNYCFRLLSLIAENNTTQNLEYQTNSQPTGNKNELVSTVMLKRAIVGVKLRHSVVLKYTEWMS